jgi:DHA1 family bicyclomycin/chloramphenicol resistance-like MFS transporter
VDDAPRLSDFGPRRLFALIVILGGLSTVGPFAIDLYLPALPTVAKDLGATTQSIALTVTTFLVGLALGQLISGPLSDAYGRRRPLLAGLGVFTASSLVCALTPSVGLLVGVRLIQGLAGASGVAIANAIVTDYARGRQAARLLSRLALVGGLAPVVAPLLGAQLLRLTSWRGIFVVLTGIGVVLVASVAFGLRESLPREQRFASGAGPILRVMGRLSCDLGFMGYALTSALAFMGFFAYLAGSSFVYQDIYGASPVLFSVLFAGNALGMLAASQLNHWLLARCTPRQLLGAGLVAGAVAAVSVLVVTVIGGLGIAALAVPLFVLVSSIGLVMPNSTALALSLHPEVAGSTSAYFGTLRYGLGALATPLVGIGGTVSGLPMALVMAVSGIVALALFALVARRTRDEEVRLDLPLQAAANMPVG